jgi:predicted MFS family arabinose efflux permease
LIGVGSGAIGALTGGLLARELGLTAPFWFAAAMMAVVAFASLPFVHNRTVAEAPAGIDFIEYDLVKIEEVRG